MVVVEPVPRRRASAWDVLQNGYWHARSPEFLTRPFMRLIEWLRMPADLIFIFAGRRSAGCGGRNDVRDDEEAGTGRA